MVKAYHGLVNILQKNKSCLGMIFVQLAYTGMSMFSKAVITNGMSPYVFVAYRQAFATIALAPFAYFLDRKKADPMSYSLIWKVFLICLFGISMSLNLYTYAIKYVSATFASASINTIPVLTFIITVAFRIENVSIREFSGLLKIVGSVSSLSGAMVFALVKGAQVNFLNWFSGIQQEKNPITQHISTKEWVQGCLLMFLANIAWACWLVLQAPLVKQYPAKFRLTMMQCLFSCIQSSIWAMSIERDISSWRLQWDLNLFSVAYCGLVVTGISYWLQLWAVENKGPLFAAAFTPLTLIFTVILSAFIWKEMLYLGRLESLKEVYGIVWILGPILTLVLGITLGVLVIVCIFGGMLLIGGLYCVIWGKNKEAAAAQKEEAIEEITDEVKEDTDIV